MSALRDIGRVLDPECAGSVSGDVHLDVLAWRDNTEKGKSGVISMFLGAAVFIDRRHTVASVRDGETWICRISHAVSPYVWTAVPLRRVDLGLFADADPELCERMLSVLWETNRDRLEKAIGERHPSEDRKALEDRIRALEEENAGLREEVRRLGRPPEGPPSSRPEPPADAPSGCDVEVRGDCIRCGRLPDGRYEVHISPDGGSLLIRPDAGGGVVCLNHTLCASGLRSLCGPGPIRPEAGYSEEHGGVLVRLKRCPDSVVCRRRSIDEGQARSVTVVPDEAVRRIWTVPKQCGITREDLFDESRVVPGAGPGDLNRRRDVKFESGGYAMRIVIRILKSNPMDFSLLLLVQIGGAERCVCRLDGDNGHNMADIGLLRIDGSHMHRMTESYQRTCGEEMHGLSPWMSASSRMLCGCSSHALI